MRPPRIFLKNSIYHLISRGNNQNLFLDDKDFLRFTFNLSKYSDKFIVRVLAFALMPNHIHLLVRQDSDFTLSKFMQTLTTAHANYFNLRHKRTGHLFEARFKHVEVTTDEFLVHVSRYIHLNPSSAGLVRNPEDYVWTSYQHYLGKVDLGFVDERLILAYFSKIDPVKDYKEFVEARVDYQREISLQKMFLE